MSQSFSGHFSQGVLWYFLTYVGSAHFWGVQNSEFQYFLGFLEKWIFLGGMKILWIFFWGHHKIGLVWGSFLCNLGSFFKVKVENWNIFLGLLKFQIFFWGAWNSWYFWGWTVDAGSEPTYAEKIEYPPPPPRAIFVTIATVKDFYTLAIGLMNLKEEIGEMCFLIF